MRTQVAIVGAGPAGSLLSLLLRREGIESVVIERQTRDYVLGRIRAGVLEWTSVEILRSAGLADRLDVEGQVHDSVKVAWRGEQMMSMDFERLAGKPMLSRYYVQCPLDDTVENWSDDRFWTELLGRIPASQAEQIVTGPSIEKSITPLRSHVVEPMQHGRLFLAGDAAHIVPPTGAKGLNLAIADVHYLSKALAEHYSGQPERLESYSATALRRVWSSVRFSWWLTVLLHRFPDQSPFEQRAREEDLAYLASSVASQTSFCEQYTGLDL